MTTVNASLSQGVVHCVPDDLANQLMQDHRAVERWESLTPLARNEWLCWVADAKKTDTRTKRILRVSSDLLQGKRRPCCWPGCKHRSPSAVKKI